GGAGEGRLALHARDRVDEPLRRGKRRRAAGQQPGHHRGNLSVQLASGHGPGDQANLGGPGGADPLTAQEQCERVRAAVFGQADDRDDRGRDPTLTSVKANRASAPAMEMSHAAASPIPPPTQWPAMRASTGFGASWMSSSTSASPTVL